MVDRAERIPGVDAAYLSARLVVILAIGGLAVSGMLGPFSLTGSSPLEWGLVLFVFTSFGAVIGYRLLRLDTPMLLWAALYFDLVAGGLLIVGTHQHQDPMYTWYIALAVIYASVLSLRQGAVACSLLAAGYLCGHIVAGWTMHTTGDYVLLTIKALALVLVAYFVARGMHHQREREKELATSHADVENLNLQLRRRLSELNAVSEITEVVHSSLDFDAIGALVLEIIQKVIDVPACSLLVLDKEKAETLFAATAGLGAIPASVTRTVDALVDGDQGTVAFEDGLFSCLSVLEHGRMMVVFCAAAEQIENMRLEDRLVLQAVASELAVAVENSQLYKLTKRLSITDELTGLFNYRHLQQRLDDEFERARRYDRPLSLLMIDTDDFKAFNDSYGHVAGDRALADLGQVVKTTVREIDIPARYGGEEFAVILPETDAAGAFVVAEKLREAVANRRFCDNDGQRTVELTISLGLATFPVHADDREGLLRQADDALYQAKHLGRDRVRAAQPVVRPVDDAQGKPA